jgi:hypothetical protein
MLDDSTFLNTPPCSDIAFHTDIKDIKGSDLCYCLVLAIETVTEREVRSFLGSIFFHDYYIVLVLTCYVRVVLYQSTH